VLHDVSWVAKITRGCRSTLLEASRDEKGGRNGPPFQNHVDD
jgi:hypothetical protein